MFESGENYLETILVLQKRSGHVRAVDVANELGFSKPSVSRAMSILRKKEYITTERDGRIVLTDEGRRMAEAIYERHRTIATYLEKALDVPPELADADACRIEHIVSEQTFLRIKQWVAAHS
jgi:DtxR family Mn-dependent transcriptional regulator